MPELPDIVVYIEALQARILGRVLEKIRMVSPFLLRTADPPLVTAEGKRVRELRRIGKRIAIGLEGDLWLVLHLMIAGRLHWQKHGAKVSRPRGLAAFDFSNGTLVWTEAGSKKRASLHVVRGDAALLALDPGGLEVLNTDLNRFAEVLTASNHTLKRALTDPRLFSGIGNAYSDEILFEARLSPLALTQKLTRPEIERLFLAIRTTLTRWVDELRVEAGDSFPREGNSLPSKHGSARSLQRALRALRDENTTHPLRVERDQLLPPLPDQRKAAGRSCAITALARGLAADARGSRATHSEVAARYLCSRSAGRS